MAKCIKCGGSFLTRGRIKLADADICFKCFDSLGFDHKTGIYTGKTYSWNDIKDGADALLARRHAAQNAREASKLGVSEEQYKQLYNADATDREIEIFTLICNLLRDEDRDPDPIDVALGDNGSLLLMIDGVVFIRYKYDSGVKWISFENESSEKVRISGPAQLSNYARRVAQAYDSAAV